MRTELEKLIVRPAESEYVGAEINPFKSNEAYGNSFFKNFKG
jgi:hypothetical protein